MQNTYTYEDAEDLVFGIERALAGVGVKIEPGSIFEECCLTILRLAARYRGEHPVVGNDEDVRVAHRNFVGLADFAAKLHSVSQTSAFAGLKAHLALLNSRAVVQNTKSEQADEANNKLFELYLACLCIAAGATEVRLDSPKNAKGDNPDVIATFDGVVWGFACKALHSADPRALTRNLAKAINQIERAPVTVGIPVLSLKNVLPHDELWFATDDPNAPGDFIFTAYPSSSTPVSMMHDFVERLQEAFVEFETPANILSMFAGKKSVPAFLSLSSTVTATLMNEAVVPTRLNLATLHRIEALDGAAQSVIDRLHYQFQVLVPPPVRP
ncbi:MAG: hypothetical protein WBW32_07810 [Luteibacter sp.]